jgi:hypothetical protein
MSPVTRTCLTSSIQTGASERELRIRRRLRENFEAYAERCLKIRAKSGSVQKFEFNRAQRFIHARLEDQLRRTGKVRALILKGRQQGCSTYVGGRFYHRVTHSKGIRVFILTHEQPATDNLFEMVNRFHDHCPEILRPTTSAANAKELYFNRLDSGYKVATAGTKGVGRSSTVQLFHGSEVALWQHAETHAAGVLQAVPNEPGTEIILESTALGVGNFFHREWVKAERGESAFQAVFVPWYWQDEYAVPVPKGFALNEEERSYLDAYGLTMEQAAWRRMKMTELSDPALFMQEYPSNAAEAFQMTGHDSFIPAPLLVKARKNTTAQASGPLVIGFDPAWKGPDRHSMAWRQGRKVIKMESKQGLDTMASAGWAKHVIDRDKPVRMFVDVGGVGAGVYDRLCEMGYGDIVRAVNFGSAPFEPAPLDEAGRPSGGPLNRRVEMWLNSRKWLEDAGGVSIPDSDSLQADACGPGYKYDSLSRIVLESKEDMRKRDVASPDEWDAVALTFAEPVAVQTRYQPRPLKGIV